MKTVDAACPVCASRRLALFFELRDVRVHCNVLCSTREEALAVPRGDIELAIYHECAFITNVTFDPAEMRYDQKYEIRSTSRRASGNTPKAWPGILSHMPSTSAPTSRAGSWRAPGSRLWPPESLLGRPPEAVMVMNPVYHHEVRSSLARLEIESAVVAA